MDQRQVETLKVNAHFYEAKKSFND